MKLPQLILYNPFSEIELPERMVWTASSVRLFRKCKRKFFWKYMMRLRSRFGDRNLMIGTAFHHCLGEWYKGPRASMSHIAVQYTNGLKKALISSNQYYNQEDVDKFEVMVNTFVGMMMGYEELYSKDRRRWKIDRASIEHKFKLNMGDFDFAGKVDLIAASEPNRFLVEHKTVSSMRGSYIDRLPMDIQIRGYVYGAINSLHANVNEVLYDIVKKCKLRRKTNESIDDFNARVANAYASEPSSYFYREELRFSKSDMDAFEFELRQVNQEYQAIRAPLRDVKPGSDKFWRELFASVAPNNPRAWSPNDGACDDYFRLCEYHRLCSQGLDKGTGMNFEQSNTMHDELEDIDA